jgi:BMFP domain-containing protein YqiC
MHNFGARHSGALRKNCATHGRPESQKQRATLALFSLIKRTADMLAPKALLDALSDQASRLFSGDTAQPRAELESQFKVLMQSAFSKLDLVSREEFDSQMVVLARTRARLEALEKQVAELDARMAPAAAPQPTTDNPAAD